MSYRVFRQFQDTSANEVADGMNLAEQEGYRYIGSTDRHVIMHKQEHGAKPWTLARIAEMLREAVGTDGDHHKQWYLEQIAEGLEVMLPDHEEGIAP